MCSALLAALLLESEVARAGDGQVARAGDGLSELSEQGGAIGSTSLLDRVMPANENLTEVDERRRAAETSASKPTPPPAPSRPAISDERTPIRLDARSVLGLYDVFIEPWRASLSSREAPLFQSRGSRIRWLEPGIAENETAPGIERPLSSPAVGSGWLGDHVELSFNDGIAYRENLEWRGMHLRLKIWGPVVKGDPGVGIRLRGFELNGYPVEMRARATSDLQDLQLRIDF